LSRHDQHYETHAKGKSRLATFGIIIGFVIMMTLDHLLG
jgi:hypothetical protein